jgi:hypothetical protein
LLVWIYLTKGEWGGQIGVSFFSVMVESLGSIFCAMAWEEIERACDEQNGV